jgi:hypothetical protein
MLYKEAFTFGRGGYFCGFFKKIAKALLTTSDYTP